MKLNKDKYYGINTENALSNFNIKYKAVNLSLIKAIALVKKAAAMANKELNQLKEDKADSIIKAAEEIIEGEFDDEFLISAIQGGAGTSTNMNVNEVIANRAMEILEMQKGEYSLVHPLNHVNMSQSTNDVYPTALRMASIKKIRVLSDELAKLQEVLQTKENEFSDVIKLGRTQLMDAVPMMVGQGFGSYSQAIGRDRWRIYKVEERLRQINLGGTAIGTGLNASNKFIFLITDIIQHLTGMGIARAEFPMDITQNMDVFVEVSGLLKACSVNLMKISNDFRLLSSGPRGGIGELKLPKMQIGSTIMPGKVNPVIPEFVAQIAIKVMSNDYAITTASSMGQLELNAFIPIIADSLLESLELLTDGIKIFREKCISEIEVDIERCRENLEKSTALVTALVHHIGYDKSAEIAKKSIALNTTIREVLLSENILTVDEIEMILNPYEVTKPGIPGKK